MTDVRKTYEDETQDAYALWRGNTRTIQVPAHWDDLSPDEQEAFRTVYIRGRLDAQAQ